MASPRECPVESWQCHSSAAAWPLSSGLQPSQAHIHNRLTQCISYNEIFLYLSTGEEQKIDRSKRAVKMKGLQREVYYGWMRTDEIWIYWSLFGSHLCAVLSLWFKMPFSHKAQGRLSPQRRVLLFCSPLFLSDHSLDHLFRPHTFITGEWAGWGETSSGEREYCIHHEEVWLQDYRCVRSF